MQKVRELIRAIIEEKHLSMGALSRAMGKNHAYLQQYLERGVPRHLPEDARVLLAQSLGLDESALRDSPEPKKGTGRDKFSASIGLHSPLSIVARGTTDKTIDKIKVLGMAECCPDGCSLWNGDVVDLIDRPPSLAGVPNAYAVFIAGDSMADRYLPGEAAYIHPGKPVTPGCFALVQIHPKDDGEAPRAFLKRLVKRSGDKVILSQSNPPKTFTLKVSEVISMHRVVGSAEV